MWAQGLSNEVSNSNRLVYKTFVKYETLLKRFCVCKHWFANRGIYWRTLITQSYLPIIIFKRQLLTYNWTFFNIQTKWSFRLLFWDINESWSKFFKSVSIINKWWKLTWVYTCLKCPFITSGFTIQEVLASYLWYSSFYTLFNNTSAIFV